MNAKTELAKTANAGGAVATAPKIKAIWRSNGASITGEMTNG